MLEQILKFHDNWTSSFLSNSLNKLWDCFLNVCAMFALILFTCVMESCPGMPHVYSPFISTAPMLTRTPPCMAPSSLSTQVQPGTRKGNGLKQLILVWKNITHVPQVLTTCLLIIRVYFLFSSDADEPELAKQVDSHTTENGYKTNTFLIPNRAGRELHSNNLALCSLQSHH